MSRDVVATVDFVHAGDPMEALLSLSTEWEVVRFEPIVTQGAWLTGPGGWPVVQLRGPEATIRALLALEWDDPDGDLIDETYDALIETHRERERAMRLERERIGELVRKRRC